MERSQKSTLYPIPNMLLKIFEQKLKIVRKFTIMPIYIKVIEIAYDFTQNE